MDDPTSTRPTGEPLAALNARITALEEQLATEVRTQVDETGFERQARDLREALTAVRIVADRYLEHHASAS